jgi:hypothetical protein
LRWVPILDGVSSPAAVATGERRVALFVRGARGELLALERDGAAWSEPQQLDVAFARAADWTVPIDWPIAACATGDACQLLARGPEGDLLHATWNGASWEGFEQVGVPATPVGELSVPMGLSSAPVGCSRARAQMDVFAVSAAGALLHSHWNGDDFEEFAAIAGDEPITGPISAANCGTDTIVVAARGRNGDALVKWRNGAQWTSFQSLGFVTANDPVYPEIEVPLQLASAPVICGGGSAWLDLFARGPGGDLLRKTWNGKSWTKFQSIGQPPALAFSGVSIAACWTRYQLNVFACATDGKLYCATWAGASDAL